MGWRGMYEEPWRGRRGNDRVIVSVVSACGKRGARTRREEEADDEELKGWGSEKANNEGGETRAEEARGKDRARRMTRVRASGTRARIRSGSVHARADPGAETRMSAWWLGVASSGERKSGP